MHPDTALVHTYYDVIAAVPEVTLYEKVRDSRCSFIVFFSFQSKKKGLFLHTNVFFLFLPSFISSWPRSGVAMPFGCLAIGEKKDYNNPSDVTDKYDLGQIVKS